jgi:hypothetical protein
VKVSPSEPEVADSYIDVVDGALPDVPRADETDRMDFPTTSSSSTEVVLEIASIEAFLPGKNGVVEVRSGRHGPHEENEKQDSEKHDSASSACYRPVYVPPSPVSVERRKTMKRILGFMVLLMFIVPSQDTLADAHDMGYELAAAANPMDIAIDVDLDCAETVTAPVYNDGRSARTTECESATVGDELDVLEAALNLRPPDDAAMSMPSFDIGTSATMTADKRWIFVVVNHVSNPLLC